MCCLWTLTDGRQVTRVHLSFPCSQGVCAASVKRSSEWNAWAGKDGNPLMERKDMDNVSLCGSCLIGGRVNRNEDCILPYKFLWAVHPMLSLQKDWSTSFFTFRASEELRSVLESIHKALQHFPSSRVQMVQSKSFFFLYEFWNACSGEYCVKFIYIYIKDHSI